MRDGLDLGEDNSTPIPNSTVKLPTTGVIRIRKSKSIQLSIHLKGSANPVGSSEEQEEQGDGVVSKTPNTITVMLKIAKRALQSPKNSGRATSILHPDTITTNFQELKFHYEPQKKIVRFQSNLGHIISVLLADRSKRLLVIA
ncbi:hypothetical protein TNCV_3532021 [Trichonephila clavipes]|nr:hypothetical protein TNCV_3532021 [Trichonephila clavipes]